MPGPDPRRELHTGIGKAEPDRVLVRGRDLTGELLGRTSFAEMVGLMLLAKAPTPGEARMLDALLTVLVEHGLQPVLAARLTYYQAPEALQGAVAAAILGAGSKHLGSSELCARMLQEAGPAGMDDDELEAAAAAIVDRHRERREVVPGIGHRTHPEGDPRAVRLFEIARETETYGPHSMLLDRVSAAAGAKLGRALPINVTGAIGAIASDLGFRWEVTKAFAIIGRTLGAVAHVQEEMDRPLHPTIKAMIDAAVVYEPGELGPPDDGDRA